MCFSRGHALEVTFSLVHTAIVRILNLPNLITLNFWRQISIMIDLKNIYLMNRTWATSLATWIKLKNGQMAFITIDNLIWTRFSCVLWILSLLQSIKYPPAFIGFYMICHCWRIGALLITSKSAIVPGIYCYPIFWWSVSIKKCSNFCG